MTADSGVRNAAADPLTVHINADARQVWNMLREPALIAQWHGWDLPGLDEEIREIYFGNVTEAADHTGLTLEGGDRFVLRPVPDGILVSLIRGPADPDAEWPDEEITEGWAVFLQQLRFALERHPHGVRRTAYFGGTARDGVPLISRLGLDGLPAAGEEYKAALPFGPELEGRVWFRNQDQIGLTVHSYAEHGDGLLVVSDRAARSAGDPVDSMLIASCYGLGARALREIWAGWDAFRAEHYPESELTTSRLS